MRYGICEECRKENTYYEWCKECNAKRFQQYFKNWTSGNNDIDKFIQSTQLSATDNEKALEWIPYNKLYGIVYIAKGGFGKVYRARWLDGDIRRWDNKNKNWERVGLCGLVALKSLYNSENVTSEFINEIKMHRMTRKYQTVSVIRVYGITQDPETKNYMMVMQYAENGSLRAYLDKNYHELSWKTKLKYLRQITLGLQSVHEKELIHQDLHIGNILSFKTQVMVTDMGLCKPADYNASENTKKSIYGVLPYIAPEVLRGQNYTKAADIYSFGIIMYEVISGLPPYHDVNHDKNLAIKICQGLRPRFSNFKVPQLIVNLVKRCLDANPINRPEAVEIGNILYSWLVNRDKELLKQIEEAEKINNSLPTSCIPSTCLSYETHSKAIYTSRLLNFNNLPEPKNSDDYYNEQNDNIISEKFSESLQIDISQVKINEI